MKAVAMLSAPAGALAPLANLELPEPAPGARDVIVDVRAVSVNPVDMKVRRRTVLAAGAHRVLGWDAAGVVAAVGSEVTRCAVGDRVWYAGELERPGSNAERQAVDERLVGPMPASLAFAEAAALPLTAITAWELLFDRIGVVRDRAEGQPLRGLRDREAHVGEALLIVGGAGGVGSILIQLARRLTGLTVIATASRPETREWCLALGAHHVLDHARPLDGEAAALGIPIAYVASLTETGRHFPALAALLEAEGRIGVIDDPVGVDATLLKRKSISLHWESMFTRSAFKTRDMGVQGEILGAVAALVDAGTLKSTLGERAGTICAADVEKAHAAIESGATRGKIVLEGAA